MKKSYWGIALCLMLIAVTAISVSAYTLETDDEWFSPWVSALSAPSGTLASVPTEVVSPADKMTVGEAVTIAAKLNAAYYGNKITVNSGDSNPYDSYVSYAQSAGIIQDGWFDDFDREIARMDYEMHTGHGTGRSILLFL